MKTLEQKLNLSKERISEILFESRDRIPSNNDPIPEDSFFGLEGFSDLEVEELEVIIGGWDSDGQRRNYRKGTYPYNRDDPERLAIWGTYGRDLLNVMLRNPPTTKAPIQYIQDAVKYLYDNRGVARKLSHLFKKYDGIFLRLSDLNEEKNIAYRVRKLRNYFGCLSEVVDLLNGTEQELLCDIAGSIKKVLNSPKIRKARKIAQRSRHPIIVHTDKAIKQGRATIPGHSLEYVISGKERITLSSYYDSNLTENYEEESHNMNAYTPIWKAITAILQRGTGNPLESLAFLGSILGYVNGISHFSYQYRKRAIKHSFAQILTGENRIEFEKSTHPLLAGNEGITPNSIRLEETPNVHILAGPYSSGKTTYTTQIGLLSLMSMIGCATPAKKGQLKVPTHIYTHFEKQEPGVGSEESKYTEQGKRQAQILRDALKSDLVLLMEPRSGASDDDAIGEALGEIYVLEKIGCTTIYVTHKHDIQTYVASGIFPHTENLKTEVKGTKRHPEFTHRIVHGVAGKSYGEEIARSNGFDIESIIKQRGLPPIPAEMKEIIKGRHGRSHN